MRNVIRLIILSLLVVGCSTPSRENTSVNPRLHRDKSTLFGFVKIVRNRVNITENAVVYIEGLEPFKLGEDGYFVAFAEPDQVYRIEKIEQPDIDKTYNFTNLLLITGPLYSKTYFGEITVQVREADSHTGEKNEEWRWFVKNKWRRAVKRWNEESGASWRKTYTALAHRDEEQTYEDGTGKRQVASDRNAVILGF